MAAYNATGVSQPQQYNDNTGGGDNQAAAGELAKQGVDYAKKSITMYRQEDAELWDLVSALPRLSGVWPYICFFLNIILPGTGTMICSCVGYPEKWSKTQLVVGVV